MLSVFPAALGTPFPEYFPKTAKRHPLVGHLLLHDLAKRIRQVRDAKIFVALDNSLVNLILKPALKRPLLLIVAVAIFPQAGRG
jgi:hypothetical protein